MYVCIHTYADTYVYVCKHIHMHVCVYTHTYMCVYIYVYIHIYIYETFLIPLFVDRHLECFHVLATVLG